MQTATIGKLEWLCNHQTKIDFKTNDVTRDKEENFIIIKGSIHPEDVTIIDICAPNNRALKYMN